MTDCALCDDTAEEPCEIDVEGHTIISCQDCAETLVLRLAGQPTTDTDDGD